MKFNITLDKLTGNPDPSGWVYLHDFTPISSESLASKGRLIMLISMLSKGKTPELPNGSAVISKEILARFHESYYHEVTSSAYAGDLLTKTVTQIQKDFSSPNESLQILAAIIINEKIIFTGVGEVEVWIGRNGQLAKIINSASSVQTSAGSLNNGDTFYIGTSAFFNKITPDVLKSPKNFKSVKIKPEGNIGLIILKANGTPDTKDIQIPQVAEKPNLTPIPKKISPIRIALANAIDKIISILPAQKLYIREDLSEVKSNKKKKIATSVGAVLFILLVISILFGTREQKIKNSESQYAGTLEDAEHKLDEANSLANINADEARSLILSANDEMQNLVNLKIKDAAITNLANSITNAMGNIAGFYNETPSMYFDLSLQSSGFNGDDITASDNRMAVLDRAGKRLLSIDIDTTKADMIAGPDIMPNANLVAAYSDRNFVSSNDGIWEVDVDKANVVIPPDSAIGNNILISAYTGNFYVLDKANDAVWRYQGDGGNFDPKQNWFGAGIKPDLSNITAWTIDGNIWMLTSDGQILRFSGGSPIDFSMKDLDKPLQAVDIFTTQDSDYLYILDSGNSRVLVVNKSDGSFKAQYVSDNIKNAKKIIVSEADKKIILLEGQKLYSLDLKNL